MLPQVLCSMSGFCCMTGTNRLHVRHSWDRGLYDDRPQTRPQPESSAQCPYRLLRAYAFLTPLLCTPSQGQVASISQSSKKTTSFLSWD